MTTESKAVARPFLLRNLRLFGAAALSPNLAPPSLRSLSKNCVIGKEIEHLMLRQSKGPETCSGPSFVERHRSPYLAMLPYAPRRTLCLHT